MTSPVPSFTCCFSSATPGSEQETKCEEKKKGESGKSKANVASAHETICFPRTEQAILFHFKARTPLPKLRGTSSCLNIEFIKLSVESVEQPQDQSLITEHSARADYSELSLLGLAAQIPTETAPNYPRMKGNTAGIIFLCKEQTNL